MTAQHTDPWGPARFEDARGYAFAKAAMEGYSAEELVPIFRLEPSAIERVVLSVVPERIWRWAIDARRANDEIERANRAEIAAARLAMA